MYIYEPIAAIRLGAIQLVADIMHGRKGVETIETTEYNMLSITNLYI